MEGVEDGYTYWTKPELKPDGAIIPVNVKKRKAWKEYPIRLACEQKGNLTEVAITYPEEIESFATNLYLELERFGRSNSAKLSANIVTDNNKAHNQGSMSSEKKPALAINS